MLTKELERLVAAAGGTEADDNRRTKDARARDERERAEHREAEARACDDATSNAAIVFGWLASAEANELCAAMRLHGLDRVRLGWALGIVDGEWRRADRGFGSVSIDLLAEGGLQVVVVRGHHGGSSRLVASAAALAEIVPSRALATVADVVREGKALDLVARGLATRAT